MTTYHLSPIVNDTLFSPTTGLIANGSKLFFYQAATTTKQNTFTTSTSGIANSNPITLDSYGRIPTAGQVWFQDGLTYKIVLAPSGDTDPPSSGITLADNVIGMGDTSFIVAAEQWAASGFTPTYISATSFTVTGDQTASLHIGRRLKSTVTAGTIYSTITNSVFGAVTTVTVVNDSGVLDSGLSAVSYGILSSINPSVPKIALPDGSTTATQSANNNSTQIATTAYVDAAAHAGIQDFRLTLTTAVPVTTADVTGATTVYMTPFKGRRIGLYNGTSWDVYNTNEISVALGTITSDQGYDVFCYANAGVPSLEILAWTSNTARATALVMQDGILCKTGALTRRYLGSFLTTSTTQTEDSEAKRYLFNYYNRAIKSAKRLESTATWAYNGVIRQANGSTSNQLNIFAGVVDQMIPCYLNANARNNGGGAHMNSGMGLNVTNAFTGVTSAAFSFAAVVNEPMSMAVNNVYTPILGKNFIAWLEYADAATNTWLGVSGNFQSGISGVWSC